jgi:peptide/nickel transport system substrate-binding protein
VTGRVAGVSVVVATMLAGCAGATTGGASAAGAAPTTTTAPKTADKTADKTRAPLLVSGRGGTATVAMGSIPTTLNDHTVAGDTTATELVASAVWVQVFQISPGLKPKLDTNVVQSAEVVSVSPQTVVYQIDPKAVWSDGVPITAADFQYAWQSQRGGATDVDGSLDSVASTLGYKDIVSVVSSDGGRTVTVTFRTPYADWESLFNDLLPAHIAEQVGWNAGFDHFDPHVDVSAGPWVISRWIPGRQVVLDRNRRWWGAEPRYGRIVLEAVANGATLVGDMSSGQVQVALASSVNAPLIAELSSLPKVESDTRLGATMLQLEFNVRRSPLDSADVRQGIAHAVNRPAIVSQVTQPLEHYAWLDNNHLFANLQSDYVDNAAGYETVDPVAADTLLTEGGLVADSHGTWTLKGAPVTLDLTWADDDPWSAAVGPLVAGQLVSAGFDVTADPVPGAALFGTVLPGADYDLALVPIEASAYPSVVGEAFSPSTLSAAGNLTVTQDWSGFDDPKIDALFNEAQADLSADQSEATYQQIDQDLWLDMPTLPLLAEPDFVAFSATVSGVQPDPGGLGALWEMNQWAPLVPAGRSGTVPKRA